MTLPTLPLAIVLRKCPNVLQIGTVGTGLYSTFGTNILYFNSQYTVIESQRNALECDITRGLDMVSR
jgi:hypothetical protein